MLLAIANDLASGDTVSTATTIVVSVLAALPGVGGLYWTFRKRHDLREATATEFGTKMAEAAFTNMEAQVARLTDEQRRWDIDRADWHNDKRQLLERINVMTAQLQVTNQYLQMLLGTLDVHGIAHPAPPAGFHGAPPSA